jgi:hypothetical protein
VNVHKGLLRNRSQVRKSGRRVETSATALQDYALKAEEQLDALSL